MIIFVDHFKTTSYPPGEKNQIGKPFFFRKSSVKKSLVPSGRHRAARGYNDAKMYSANHLLKHSGPQ